MKPLRFWAIWFTVYSSALLYLLPEILEAIK